MHQNSIIQRQCDEFLSETLSTAAIEGEMLNRDSVKAVGIWMYSTHGRNCE